MEVKKTEEALKGLRDKEKRKFIQTLDLIVNLENFDPRKEQVNTFIKVPNPTGKKICAFLSKKSQLVDTLTETDFEKYKEAKDMKKLAKTYDFFIASAPLMSKVATKFGRYLGPLGKMPSPQAGIITQETEENIKETLEKVNGLARIRTKEKSIKLPVGKEDMDDKTLKENIVAVIKSIEGALPKQKDNIKNILIKFTMTKPERIR